MLQHPAAAGGSDLHKEEEEEGERQDGSAVVGWPRLRGGLRSRGQLLRPPALEPQLAELRRDRWHALSQRTIARARQNQPVSRAILLLLA